MREIAKKINKLPWNKKILILRIMNEWTQNEAAERCKTSQKHYWNWEKAISHPNCKNRKCISEAFNVDMDDIFK